MLLPYCIFVAEDSVTLPQIGVRGARVETFSCDGLQCLLSKHELLENISQQDALVFYQVIEGVFKQVAVIPFRFPSLLNSEEDLEAHLQAKSTVYKEDLKKFLNLVQMELTITPKVIDTNKKTSGSGTEYLQSRSQTTHVLESLANGARSLSGELVRDWRQYSLATKYPALHCYLLVPRAAAQLLRERLNSYSSPPTIIMALSGPWPATAFMSSSAAATAQDHDF